MALVPQLGGVRIYRDVDNPGVTLVRTDSKTRPADIHAAVLSAVAEAKGVALTPELAEEIRALALRRESEMLAATHARGIPDGIRALLRASKKKQALKVLREISVSDDDLHDLTCNCGVVGLTHWSKHLDFVPEGCRPGQDEREALLGSAADPDARDAAWRRLDSLYAQREHRSVHLFVGRHDRWHCFFMTYSDVAGDTVSDRHHWKEGAHLHYLSHTFDGRLTKEMVWSELDRRRHRLPTEHVRFVVDSTPPRRLRMFLDERTGLVASRDVDRSK
jgi:hypothetical protein